MKGAVAPLWLCFMTDKLKGLINNLKHLPGCYLMHDKEGKIIYVGKAKDLQKRVSQYFLRPQTGKVFAMVMHVDYFETIITKNEKEAFVLEMNLIQTHYPRYNILLKDGSHYPYIALKKKGTPFLTIKRNKKDNSYFYYGPFPNSSAAYQMVDLLNKVFPIRKCKTLGSNVCLYYHLGQCNAPCINKIDELQNEEMRNNIKSFINGDNRKQYNQIKEKMISFSDKQEFESANECKKILEAIDHISAQQNVEMKDKKDRDIFAFSIREGYIALAVLIFRRGILLGKNVFTVEQFGENEEQVSDLILQYYQNHSLPDEIIINSSDIISNLLNYLDTDILNVSRGNLFELVSMAQENAKNALDEYFLSAKLDDNKIELLDELGSLLHISTPYHIELFDNSHLQGSSPVGAMVAYINGEPAKKLYRKFKIESEESRDDLNSMKEVVYRHYSRLVENKQNLPNLILVDGGLNQIKAAFLALCHVNVDIPIFGLFKNEKHQTSGLIDIKENVYPIENKKLFFLLTRMQDEVHRFAISFHKDKRNKAMKSFLLDDIPGLGEKRKELIYRQYPDLNLLKEASLEELEQILPCNVAKSLYNKLR